MKEQHATKDAAYAAGVRDGLAHADREDKKVKAATGDDSKQPIKTLSDVKAMSTDEINSRWSDVQAVLGGQR